MLLNLRPGRFDQLAVFDSRGTCGLTGPAIETLVNVLDKRIAQGQASLVDQQDLPDAPAGGVRLETPEAVGGTVVQAKPAMDAPRVVFVGRLVKLAEPAYSLGRPGIPEPFLHEIRCLRQSGRG